LEGWSKNKGIRPVSFPCHWDPFFSVFFHSDPFPTVTQKKAPALQKSEGGGHVLGWEQFIYFLFEAVFRWITIVRIEKNLPPF
jgi:hypothetical protein